MVTDTQFSAMREEMSHCRDTDGTLDVDGVMSQLQTIGAGNDDRAAAARLMTTAIFHKAEVMPEADAIERVIEG